MPAWVITLAAELGVALVKWATFEIQGKLTEAEERAQQERIDGIRNGKNAKAYYDAKTRKDQIRAAVDLLNRNN